ncbi:MAG: hypothetical protein ACXWT4_20570 [Methylobacter sp.]
MTFTLNAKKEPEKSCWERIKETVQINSLHLVLIGSFLLATLAAISVFSAYFLTFDGKLAVDHDKWGMFGDFVGGTLNPILSFLSLISLLYIVLLQSRELKISNDTLKETKFELEQARKIAADQAMLYKKETEKNEILKAIEAVHLEIKDLFQKPADFCPNKNNMGWFFSNSAPAVSLSIIPKNGDRVSQNDRILLADLSEYILELSGYLHEYITKFGPSSVSFYYQRRYLTAKNRLVDKDFLINIALEGFKSPGYGWSAA